LKPLACTTVSPGLILFRRIGDPCRIEDALRTATATLRPGSRLKLVPLPQLVALKLYAGGLKSEADVLELLARNPEADLDEMRKVCKRYQVGGLDAILRELKIQSGL
jgi:hypothetical protein